MGKKEIAAIFRDTLHPKIREILQKNIPGFETDPEVVYRIIDNLMSINFCNLYAVK